MTTFTCRSCGSSAVREILSLGAMPLANGLLTADRLGEPEPTYPLDLVVCRQCSLVQITETVSPETLFTDYVYFSSVSESFVEHAGRLADRVIEGRALSPRDLVVEVASNDGYLLQHYVKRGIPVLGIEPAANVAAVARRERDVPTLTRFFGLELAEGLSAEGRRADVIHANNVLAHVPDLNGFVSGIRTLLKPDGLAIVEVPYVRDMVDRCEFDTIYHEHLCYFSLTALLQLFATNGLDVWDVERLDVHGGSLRVFAGHAGVRPLRPAVRHLADQEALWDGGDQAVYCAFAGRVRDLRTRLQELLASVKGCGGAIAAYGAAAKGTVLLNHLKPEPGTIAYVVDRNPRKQNRFIPGVRLPIHDPARLLQDRPSHVLLLAWNLAREIELQQAEYVSGGGKFIVPIPIPAVL